jgi:hypothetical protein
MIKPNGRMRGPGSFKKFFHPGCFDGYYDELGEYAQATEQYWRALDPKFSVVRSLLF